MGCRECLAAWVAGSALPACSRAVPGEVSRLARKTGAAERVEEIRKDVVDRFLTGAGLQP